MPMRTFIPNPAQVQQYKAGDAKQADELYKMLGLSFQPDSGQATDAQGNVIPINDGDYIGIGPDGNIRAYDKSYFERTFTELNTTAVKQQAAKS